MHHRKTYKYINFQQNWVSRSVKTMHTNLLAKNCMQLEIRKITPFGHALPRTFRPILRSIGLLDNELPQKEIIFTDDRRTDRPTGGRTDGQSSRTTTIGSFFEKRKLLKKIKRAQFKIYIVLKYNGLLKMRHEAKTAYSQNTIQ